MAWALRSTRRCWQDDFGEQLEDNRVPALETRRQGHLVVRDFLNQRSQQPDGTEGPIAALGSAFMKLKCGRYRAATLHQEHLLGIDDAQVRDPEVTWQGVVWLLAVGYRKEGDPDDAYNDFERIGADALRPQHQDYVDLYASIRQAAADTFDIELRARLAELLERARSEPDVLHRLDAEPFAGIAIKVFHDHGYRILVLSAIDARRRPVSEAVSEVIVASVFPGVRLDELEFPDARLVERIADYALQPGEYALSFRYKRP